MSSCGPDGILSGAFFYLCGTLTNGVKIKWPADYCGTSVAMIEKHYGKYFGGDSEEQLSRLFGAKSEGLNGPTWIRTRDQPVMSRWL
jgi:hypothetical protein